MKRKFHDFLTLLTSTEKPLTRAGFELAHLRQHRFPHVVAYQGARKGRWDSRRLWPIILFARSEDNALRARIIVFIRELYNK